MLRRRHGSRARPAVQSSQTGFWLGGPIINDKLHFFTANEWTTENTPVTGPYADQPASAAQKFTLQPDTLAALSSS